jgi:hypothetical protein
MVKRLAFILLFIPVCYITVMQFIFCAIRWIITGQEFGEPILDKYVEWFDI